MRGFQIVSLEAYEASASRAGLSQPSIDGAVVLDEADRFLASIDAYCALGITPADPGMTEDEFGESLLFPEESYLPEPVEPMTDADPRYTICAEVCGTVTGAEFERCLERELPGEDDLPF